MKVTLDKVYFEGYLDGLELEVDDDEFAEIREHYVDDVWSALEVALASEKLEELLKNSLNEYEFNLNEASIEMHSCRVPVRVNYINADGTEETQDIEVMAYNVTGNQGLFEQDLIDAIQAQTDNYNIDTCSYEILDSDIAELLKLNEEGYVNELF